MLKAILKRACSLCKSGRWELVIPSYPDALSRVMRRRERPPASDGERFEQPIDFRIQTLRALLENVKELSC